MTELKLREFNYKESSLHCYWFNFCLDSELLYILEINSVPDFCCNYQLRKFIYPMRIEQNIILQTTRDQIILEFQNLIIPISWVKESISANSQSLDTHELFSMKLTTFWLNLFQIIHKLIIRKKGKKKEKGGERERKKKRWGGRVGGRERKEGGKKTKKEGHSHLWSVFLRYFTKEQISQDLFRWIMQQKLSHQSF